MTTDLEDVIESARLAGTRLPPQLLKYWVAGPGAAKIGWGAPGDFNRCRVNIQAEVSEKGAPLAPHIIDGLCATLHKIATGARPGHAPGESAGRAAMASDPKKPYGDVTYADPGYQKDGKKRYPIDTEAHAKAAWSYINQGDNASSYSADQLASIKGRIKSALRKFGVQLSDSNSSRQEVPNPMELFATSPYTRSYPLEDISIRSGGDGRTVEAYAAVFDTETTIVDHDGHYREVLDRTAFNRAVSDSAPQGSRSSWKVGVFYNHGMTLMGTPSDRHSMPVGVPIDIRVEPRGLLTVTRYNKTPLADEILENINDGGISGYSFSGMFKRSTPTRPRGGFRADMEGNLPVVRRMESSLREYGPTPFPAYEEASIMGMRAQQILANVYTPEELYSLFEQGLFASGARNDSPEAENAQPSAADYAALAAGDSPTAEEEKQQQERSSRSIRGQMRAQRSAWLQRHGRDES